MGLFMREGLISRDFTCGGIRYFRAIRNTFLVHSRKSVSVKLQRMLLYLSSQKFLGAIPYHLTD